MLPLALGACFSAKLGQWVSSIMPGRQTSGFLLYSLNAIPFSKPSLALNMACTSSKYLLQAEVFWLVSFCSLAFATWVLFSSNGKN